MTENDNSKQKRGLTIRQQGTLVVALAAGLEIALFGLLFFNVDLVETAAQHKKNERDMYLSAQEFAALVYQAHENVQHWVGQQDLLANHKRQLTEAYLHFEFLKSHIDKKSATYKAFVEATRCFEIWASECDSITLRTDWTPDDLDSAKSELYRARRNAQLSIEDYMTLQLDILKAATDNEDDYRRKMQGLVIAFVLLNIAVALGVETAFVRGVVARLLVMVDNTRRLSANQNLHAELRGANDEIKEVDSSFHEMAAQMRENEQLKRAYISLFRQELATPLNQVRSTFAELAPEFTGKAHAVVLAADRNLSRLVTIIDDLTGLEDSAPAPLRLTLSTCSLVDIIERAVESVSSFAKQHEVTIQVSCDDCQVEADGNRIVQVLVNLLSNAVKFSPVGGIVVISSQAVGFSEASSPELFGTALSEPGQTQEIPPSNNAVSGAQAFVRVMVTDRGRGIPAEKQKNVFEKFQQAEASDGKRGVGTGLGLSICKDIVESHGGKIGVDSEEGKGSCFWLELPLASEGSFPPAQPSEQESLQAGDEFFQASEPESLQPSEPESLQPSKQKPEESEQ